MYAAGTFVPSVIIPLVTGYSLPSAIYNRIVIRRYRFRRPKYFDNLGELSAAFPARRVRSLCIGWYFKLYDYIVFALLPANHFAIWRDRGLSYR